MSNKIDIFDGYEKSDLLGQGYNSKIYKFINPANTDAIAVKIYNLDVLLKKLVYDFELNEYRDLTSIAFKELEYYQTISVKEGSDRYMPRYIGNQQTKSKLMIAMELSHFGQIYMFDNSLNTYHINNKIANRVNKDQINSWTIDMINCIDFMHRNNYAHLDIKIENFLLFEENEGLKVKLTDYNYSKQFEKNEKVNIKYGTFLYASPETVFSLDETYNPFKTDIWALGVCIYILYKSKLPFMAKEGATNYELSYSSSTKHKEPIYTELEPDLVDLLQHMFEKENEKRWSIDEIKNSTFYLNHKSD